MSIQPIPPSTGPTTAGQLAARATANDQAMAVWLGDHDGRIEDLESRSGTSVAGYVDTADDLDNFLSVEDGLMFLTLDTVKFYVRSRVEPSGWAGPVDAQGAATDAAVANAVTKPVVLNALTTNGKRPVGKDELVANVRDYGAKGDGTTNDTAAFNAALAAADNVYVPPGSYFVRGVNLTTGKTLYGAGASSRLIHNLSLDCIAGTGTAVAPLTRITVRDLAIVANKVNGDQRGINFNYVNDSTISNVTISGEGNNAINWFYSKRGRITDCNISDSGFFGILIYRSSRITIEGNYIHDIVGPGNHLGFQFKNSTHCIGANNTVENIAGYGIYTWDDGLEGGAYPDREHIITGNQVTGCTTQGFAGIGILVQVSPGCRVIGNIVRDTQNVGISIPAPFTTVEGNHVSTTSTASAQVPGISTNAASTMCVIANNHVTDYHQGILLSSASGCRVIGNVVYDLQAAASSLNAGIRLTAANGSTVSMNSVVDTRGAGAQNKRGVYVESGTGNILMGNQASGSTVQDFFTAAGNFTLSPNSSDANRAHVGGATSALGFFGAAPVVKPTGVTADAASIRTALINLGLIA